MKENYRCKLVGSIHFRNGRSRKFEGEIPVRGSNSLDLGAFYAENKDVNPKLLKEITGKCYDLETGEEITVWLV